MELTLTRIMWCALLVCSMLTVILCEPQTGFVVCSHHSTFRRADNADLTVICGPDNIYLTILLCPIYYEGYNESLLALNSRLNISACCGIPDFGARTPILTFNFSIFEEQMSLCGNSLELTDQVGTYQFSNNSRVQLVNISGSVHSWKPSISSLTQRQELIYQFSCPYSLQYLSNSTKVSLPGISTASRENKGSFISALRLNLFTNRQFTQPLQIPESGLPLKTRIYVQVKATHLANRFNVLLVRCYTTTSPNPTSSTYYDLFFGCKHDGQTVMYINGVSQEARFSFEAFRFLEHQNKTISTFYLHCVTRLCENSTCSAILTNCMKVRNAIQSSQDSGTAETVSSGPIKTQVTSVISQSECTDCVSRMVILTCVLGVCCSGLVVFFIIMYRGSKCVFR